MRIWWARERIWLLRAKSCLAAKAPARGAATQPGLPWPTAHLESQHGFSVGISPPQRPAKPSEKPRLRQIPSAEDLETDGGGVGPVGDDGLEHRESSHGQHEARGPIPLQQHQQVWQRPLPWEGAVGRLWGLAQTEGREPGYQCGRQLRDPRLPYRIRTKVQARTPLHASGHKRARACVLICPRPGSPAPSGCSCVLVQQ